MNKSPLTENLNKEIDLLKRTIKIYCYIEKEQPIGISKLSEKLSLPEHKVRYSLRMLEKEKMIEPSPVGATLTEKHPIFKEDLKDLLKEIINTTDSLYDDLCD
ncbi:MAG: FaeA/PapI family transcriptional regulator [Thermoplasmatota archaeon]